MPMQSYEKRKRFAQKITAILSENYREKNSFPKKASAPLSENHASKRAFPKMNALDSFVAVILSQNTSDKNSLRAFANLKKRFGNLEKMTDANLNEIKKEIRVGGLENIKAERIRSALREIKKRKGNLSLDFLKKMETEEAKRFLTSIKGIGQKSASVVLAFSFGRGLIPVDTHVLRVSKRLGLVGRKSTPDKAQNELEVLIHTDKRIQFHLNLIRHGREICKAQVPKCSICFLKKICPRVGVKNFV